MIRILLLISILYPALNLFPVEMNLTVYQFFREVVMTAERQEVAAVILDSIIWNSGEGIPEMRIVTEAGRSIPHIYRKAEETRLKKIRESRKASISKLEEKPDGSIELLLEIVDKTGTTNLLEIVTPLKDFERVISVKGVNPEGKETLLTENVPIYDYSRFADIRHTTIELPPNEFRRFKVKISNLTDEILSPKKQITKTIEGNNEVSRTEESAVIVRNFRIDALLIYYEHETESHKVEKIADKSQKNFRITEDKELNNTILEIETYNEPFSGLTIETSERNFSRRISVEIPFVDGGKEKWHPIASATVSNISFRDFKREELKVTFSENQSRRLKIVIHNDDNMPLPIIGVKLHGPVWRALFLTEPGDDLKLYFGGKHLKPVNQDTEPLIRILESGFEPSEFSLSKVFNNPVYSKSDSTTSSSWMDFFGSKLFFIIAAGLMVLVISAALIKSVKRIQE